MGRMVIQWHVIDAAAAHCPLLLLPMLGKKTIVAHVAHCWCWERRPQLPTLPMLGTLPTLPTLPHCPCWKEDQICTCLQFNSPLPSEQQLLWKPILHSYKYTLPPISSFKTKTQNTLNVFPFQTMHQIFQSVQTQVKKCDCIDGTMAAFHKPKV